MSEDYNRNIIQAVRDFRRARLKGDIERLMARLTGKSASLLSYEDVRRQLRAGSQSKPELKDIPLDAIVGSVDRYRDFTRSFHPLHDSDQRRWANIEVRAYDQIGLPPIEVYQIGEAYFVLDGNHRVSVAREMEATHIEAYVTKVQTRLPLSPDADPNEVILKARYLDFLERTQLDKLRPEADLTVTVPGQYRILDMHIELHRYFMGLEQDREIPYEEAVTNWYDEVYSVVVQGIRDNNFLEHFPDRTETDLYLLVSGYRVLVEGDPEWSFGLESGSRPINPQIASRFSDFVNQLVTKTTDQPPTLAPGEWRRDYLLNMLKHQTQRPFRLFKTILVPVDGRERGWYALNQALGVARRDGGRLLGLHVVSSAADKESPAVQLIKAEFNQRCVKAGIPGKLAVEAGPVAQTICARARWADLVVIRVIYPPASQPMARLGSGLRTMIRQCRCPLLIVPRSFVYPLDRALLAFDGSPKAEEALYMATYLASQWGMSLVVVTVTNGSITPEVLARAQNYLQSRNVEATYVHQTGGVAEGILQTAGEQDSNLIIMGGYGYNPVLELVLGSAVDEVLRKSQRPMLICG